MILCDVVGLVSGTPQFRIKESALTSAPSYALYSQSDLEGDLSGLVYPDVPSVQSEQKRCVRTFDAVVTAAAGDTVFSLLTGTAAVVLPEHDGYLLTQNYVKLVPSGSIDPRYLVYLLNENQETRRRLRLGQQGSATMKFTLKQLKTLELPTLAPRERQERIGELYLNMRRLGALKKLVSEQETILMLEAIREADRL